MVNFIEIKKKIEFIGQGVLGILNKEYKQLKFYKGDLFDSNKGRYIQGNFFVDGRDNYLLQLWTADSKLFLLKGAIDKNDVRTLHNFVLNLFYISKQNEFVVTIVANGSEKGRSFHMKDFHEGVASKKFSVETDERALISQIFSFSKNEINNYLKHNGFNLF